MEAHDRPEHERIKALLGLRQKQEEIVGAASNLWGSINEELGAKILEQFQLENRIQSYVLACRGSRMDSNGVDAVLHLYDQSFMPLNFKSSKKGKEHHEEVYGRRIPSLVVNQGVDPELARARYELGRLIDTWYGNYAFENSQLIPCFRLYAKSAELLRLREEVTLNLDAIQATGGALYEGEGAAIRISSILSVVPKRREHGYVAASILLANGPFMAFEFYRGARILAWAGKKNTTLIVLPETTPTEDFREVILAGIRKTKRT